MVMYESSLEVMSETRWNEYVDEVQLALLKKNQSLTGKWSKQILFCNYYNKAKETSVLNADSMDRWEFIVLYLHERGCGLSRPKEIVAEDQPGDQGGADSKLT